MTIPATGPVNLSAVGSEISLPLLSPVSMNDTEVRKLANKTTPNSIISMNDFHGTSYGQGGGYGDLDFTNVIDQFPNTTITSNVIYIVGAGTTPVSFAIFATLASEYSINGGAWTSKSVLGSIKNGDTLQLRTLLGTYSSINTVSAQFNGVTKAWSATVGVKSILHVYVGAELYASGTNLLWRGSLAHSVPSGYTLTGEGGEAIFSYSAGGGNVNRYISGKVAIHFPTQAKYCVHYTIPYVNTGVAPFLPVAAGGSLAVNGTGNYGASVWKGWGLPAEYPGGFTGGNWGNLYNTAPYSSTGGGTMVNGVYYRGLTVNLYQAEEGCGFTILEFGPDHVF